MTPPGRRVSRAQFEVRRAAAMPARHRQRLANLRSSSAARPFVEQMERLADRPVLATDKAMLSAVRFVDGSTETALPFAMRNREKAIRNMIVREGKRSLARARAVAEALADPQLQGWLQRVDRHWPGLPDAERVRLAQLLDRHADTVQQADDAGLPLVPAGAVP